MNQSNTQKATICPVCDQSFKGRIDKKFCSSNCKSIYHYERKIIEDQKYFSVNRQLKTNRKVLKKYNRTGMTSLRREVLHAEGFNPAYFTHQWKNKRGQTYYFSFDLGILPLEDRKGKTLKYKYLIIEWQDYMQAKPPFV